MLKNSVLVKIKEILSSHRRFDSSDFGITSAWENDSTQVKITYIGDEKYVMSFVIPMKISAVIYGKITPDVISLVEDFAASDLDTLFIRIYEWEEQIWLEIEANPIVRRQNK